MDADRVRVLIADDDPTVRQALADLLTLDDGLLLVGSAPDAREAISLAEQLRPDVAMLDFRMPHGGGPAAARGIRERSPETSIIALSAAEDRAAVLEMLRSGAIGYIVKGAPTDEMLNAIRSAADGHGALSSSVTTDVVEELANILESQETALASQRLQRESIRRVLQGEDPFFMVFQPIQRLDVRQTVGFEALARFPTRSDIGPDVWFTRAAEVGLGTPLELKAVRAALDQQARLPAGSWLSVNLSPSVLSSADFLDLIDRHGASELVVELTEHARVDDYAALSTQIARLRDAGGRLAIDDAGAGFASLRHILDLAPDFIKLDASLTRGIDTQNRRHALARALILFSSDIGTELVAEGIETAAEVQALRALGVSWGQGYHLGRPGPLTTLTQATLQQEQTRTDI